MTKQTSSTGKDTHSRTNVGANPTLEVTAELQASPRVCYTDPLEVVRTNEGPATSASAEAAVLEDQSSLRQPAATANVRKRRGRPRKEEAARQDRSLIQAVVEKAKAELRDNLAAFFSTRESIIRKVGDAFEKVLPKPRDVCEAIKEALAEEIEQKIISARTIETHCLAKWKKKTKPKKIQKNAESSFSESKSTSAEKVVPDSTQAISQVVATPLQQVFKITKERFALVVEVINRSKNECYVRFNDNYELESIDADEDQVTEATIREQRT